MQEDRRIIVTLTSGCVGKTGETGPAGPIGPIGVNGPPGMTGQQGPKGDEGDQGPAGTKILTNFGENRTPAELPANGFIPANWDGLGRPTHDIQFKDAEGMIYQPAAGEGDPGWGYTYVYNSALLGWTNVGKLSGPQGPQGIQGPQGQQGAVGPEGPDGPAGTRIMANFGQVKTPADLPADGEIPEDWDGPGRPAVPLQFDAAEGMTYQPIAGSTDPEWGDVYVYSPVLSGWSNVGKLAGPRGPAGPSVVSSDAGNDLTLGTDSFIFYNAPPGNFLPIDGKAADSQLLDGVDSLGFVKVDGSTAMAKALDFKSPDDASAMRVRRAADNTPKAIVGCFGSSETVGMILYDVNGVNVVNQIVLAADGNINAAGITAPSADEDLVTLGTTRADFYQKTQFGDSSVGVGSAGQPVLLNSAGQIDPSMLDTSSFHYVGTFTPAAGAEYPDTTGEDTGAFWAADLTADYTFTGGDLTGRVISHGDFMVWGSAGWSIMASEMNPSLYYKLDGSAPLSGPLAGGGQQLKNVGDGVDPTDAVTVQQISNLGGFLPIDGKAADSEQLDGVDGSGYVRVDGTNVMTDSLVIESIHPSVALDICPADDTGYTSLILRDGSGFSRGTFYTKNDVDYVGIQKQDAANNTVCEMGLLPDGNVELTMNPDMTADKHIMSSGRANERFYQKSQFVAASSGPNEGGKPVKLNAAGVIDSSMINVDGFTYMGEFTPTTGNEYPDNSSAAIGSFWSVNNLSSSYTFTAGDLAGRIVVNGDLMVWGTLGWSLSTGSINPDLYYQLDGTKAITAPFAGGGQQMKNVAAGTEPNDVVIISQLTDSGIYLPIAGKAADSEMLDGVSGEGFVKIDGSNHMTASLNFNGSCSIDLYDATGATQINSLSLSTDGNAELSDAGTPTATNHLVTKGWVESYTTGVVGGYLPLGGGALSGDLSLVNLSASGAITAAGNISAFSDARLKKNVNVIPDALDKIDQVRGVTFDRIDLKGLPKQTGVIAQELRAVLPEAVMEADDGTLSVAYGNVVGLLIEGIKELRAEIKALKGE